MKIALTILVSAFFEILYQVYRLTYPIVVAQTTANQLSDTNFSSVLFRLVSNSQVGFAILAIYAALIALIWIPSIKRLINKNKTTAA